MSRWVAPALPSAVLFDLDGTLLDTAPDMVGALNAICAEEGAQAVDFSTARAWVSNGAVGLLRLPFPDFDPQRHYAITVADLELTPTERNARHATSPDDVARLMQCLPMQALENRVEAVLDAS